MTINSWKKIIIAALIFFAGTPLLGATVTSKVTLNSTAWSDLGAGPALIGANGHVVFLIDDVTPAIGLQQGFSFPSNGSQCINTTSHVWAMASDQYPAWVFVAPIVGC